MRNEGMKERNVRSCSNWVQKRGVQEIRAEDSKSSSINVYVVSLKTISHGRGANEANNL